MPCHPSLQLLRNCFVAAMGEVSRMWEMLSTRIWEFVRIYFPQVGVILFSDEKKPANAGWGRVKVRRLPVVSSLSAPFLNRLVREKLSL